MLAGDTVVQGSKAAGVELVKSKGKALGVLDSDGQLAELAVVVVAEARAGLRDEVIVGGWKTT